MFFAIEAPGILVRKVKAAGFESVSECRQQELLHFGSAAKLINAVIEGGPVALAVKRFSPQVRERVDKVFLESVAPYLQRDGSYLIPGEFTTVSGKKPEYS